MRAITCRASYNTIVNFGNTDLRIVTTIIFQGGSVCYHVSYCKSYTEYGKCQTC